MSRLIEIMAAERSGGDPHLYDELLQEGLIAAWQAQQRNPEGTEAYFYIAARYRMRDVLNGRPLTGEVGRRGWMDAHDKVVAPLLDDDGALFDDPVDGSATDTYLAVEIRDEVRAAVAALPDARDREAVYLRYWGDLPWPQVAEATGHKRRLLENRWITHARPQLRETLAGVA